MVDGMARRLASFDGQAIAAAKRIIGRRSLPDIDDLRESQELSLQLARTPVFARRFVGVRDYAARVGADFDLHTGEHLGLAATELAASGR